MSCAPFSRTLLKGVTQERDMEFHAREAKGVLGNRCAAGVECLAQTGTRGSYEGCHQEKKEKVYLMCLIILTRVLSFHVV